ncbi:hypothetical protein NKH55_13580 [Mesorhizobium opportunistum]|uniref:DUF6894 family protein n=1 Tax=Mesorhizobium opportunistum TaxID=593909 RepID=UPI00333CD7A7
MSPLGESRTATSVRLRRFRQMALYHFDYRDRETLIPDVEGTEIADLETAKFEAVRILAELARSIERPEHRVLAIEVRDQRKPLLLVSLTLDIKMPA